MKKRIEKALRKLDGKDLSMFGVRAEATLNLMKDGVVTEKDLKFMEKIIEKHYT